VKRQKAYPQEFQESYTEEPFLPQLWQVIYQEAMRANHILFAKKDVRRFELEDRMTLNPTPDDELDILSGLMMKLLTLADLGSLRQFISGLPYQRRKGVYLVYRRFLESWRLFHKNSLN